MNPSYEAQFSQWVHPLIKEDFHKKKVLDAGCGMGRNSYWAVRWGAREVTACDSDTRTVAIAQKTLAGFANAKVVPCDIYELPFKNEFDLAISVGVLNHLEDPEKAMVALATALKPRGILLLSLPSREGNEWFLWALEPFRKYITSRLPPDIVHVLSFFFSIPLWLFAKALRGPTTYFKQLSKFSFWHIHSIVFGQLLPTVASFWTEKQLRALFDPTLFAEVHLFRTPTNVSWNAVGLKRS